jgi:hypothetical protein
MAAAISFSQKANRASIQSLSTKFLFNLSARPKHNHSSDDRLIQYAGQCSRHYAEAFDATGLMIDKPDDIAPRSTHPLRLM